MKQEEWKPVVGYECLYEISNWGRVKSLNYRNTGKEWLMKPSPDKWGYLRVGLCKNGKKETLRVHQLVMEAFVGKCPAGHEVDHYDWNPSNNKLENLSYQPKEVNRTRHSPGWHKNTSEANKKKAQDPEWQRKNAEKNKKLAQDTEWLEKTSEAVRKACCKPVDQYTIDGEYVKTWESASDAARELGVYKQSISLCCKGRYKSAGGYVWKLKEAV